jgi:hypothetical protein
MHPETKPGGNQHTKANAVAKLATAPAARFSRETAKVSGRPERSIQRDAARGEAIAGKARKVRGTSLDKGVEPVPVPCCRAVLDRQRCGMGLLNRIFGKQLRERVDRSPPTDAAAMPQKNALMRLTGF